MTETTRSNVFFHPTMIPLSPSNLHNEELRNSFDSNMECIATNIRVEKSKTSPARGFSRPLLIFFAVENVGCFSSISRVHLRCYRVVSVAVNFIKGPTIVLRKDTTRIGQLSTLSSATDPYVSCILVKINKKR